MRIKFLIIAIILLLAGLVGIFGFYGWFLQKQERVLVGTARPDFPYSDYSIAELNKLYPQTINENVKTTQTPEETYEKFRTALKDGNLSEAVSCCFRLGDQENMMKSLKEIKDRGLIGQMIKDLGDIKKGEGQELDNSTIATYYYYSDKNGKKIGSTIDFIKDSWGVWLIESL